MDIETKIQRTRAHKQRVALFYGAMAALAFSLVAWGYDNFQLAQANAILPWLPFFLGLVPLMLVGTLAAWISFRIDNFLVSLIVWLAAGLVFVQIASHVTFEPLQAAFRLLRPDLPVSYPFNEKASGVVVIASMVVVILSVVIGLMSRILMETSGEAGSVAGFLVPLLLWMVLFGLAGLPIENSFSSPFRMSVQKTNQWVQFALDHENIPVDQETAVQNHLMAVDPIRDVFHRPRRLVMTSYDDEFGSMDVLIEFGGIPVDCNFSFGNVNFCKR